MFELVTILVGFVEYLFAILTERYYMTATGACLVSCVVQTAVTMQGAQYWANVHDVQYTRTTMQHSRSVICVTPPY